MATPPLHARSATSAAGGAPSSGPSRTVDSLPALLEGLEQFAGWPTEQLDGQTALVTVVRPDANYPVRLRWVEARPVAAELKVCDVPPDRAGEALVVLNEVNAVLPSPGLVYVHGQIRWRTALQATGLSVPHLATLLLAGAHGAAGVLRELKRPVSK